MLKTSGHRLNEEHNRIIRKFARRWKLKDAEALRKIIEQFDSESLQVTNGLTVH